MLITNCSKLIHNLKHFMKFKIFYLSKKWGKTVKLILYQNQIYI